MAQVRIDDFVGTSNESWSDAARNAISQMARLANPMCRFIERATWRAGGVGCPSGG